MSGALRREVFLALLAEVGFTDIEVVREHSYEDLALDRGGLGQFLRQEGRLGEADMQRVREAVVSMCVLAHKP